MDVRELGMLLRAMADKARLRMLQHMALYDEISVKALTRELRISQPLASWHLRTLRRSGLINTRRVGREVHCSLNSSRLEQVREALVELTAAPGDVAGRHSPPIPALRAVEPVQPGLSSSRPPTG